MPKVHTKLKRMWGLRTHINGKKFFKQRKLKQAARALREATKTLR